MMVCPLLVVGEVPVKTASQLALRMLLEKVRESKGKKPFFSLKCCGFAYECALSVERDGPIACRLAGEAPRVRGGANA
jgi:hypothetical protein